MFGSNRRIDDYLCVLLGFSSVANGFMFRLGAYNLRICDVIFWILLLHFLLIERKKRSFYDTKIIKGIIIVFSLFLWLTISGFFSYADYNDVYQDYFVKYYINKVLWILLYAILYMAYGGKRFLFNLILGMSICVTINSLFVLYEYNSIMHGYLPDYSYLEKIGIYMDSKKDEVINQNMIRPTGLMLDPNYTGGYAGIGVIFFDYLYRQTKSKAYLLFQIVAVIPMFIVFSRTGLFSLFLSFLFSLFLCLFCNRNRKYKLLSPLIFFLLIVSTVLLGLYIFSFDEAYYESLVDRLTMSDSSVGTRTLYLEYYLQDISMAHLLFGGGTSSAGFMLGRGFNGIDYVWSPESNVIAFFIEQGFVFLFFYIVLCIYILKRLTVLNYNYALLFLYINSIGISYNFLGDRAFYLLFVSLILWSYTDSEFYSKS